MTNNRINTGVVGLDEILDGGYMKKSAILLKGGPGTGKTVFSLCFAYDQLRQGESAVIVTCEEAPERLLDHMEALGQSASQAYADGRLKILDFRPGLEDQVSGEYELSAALLRISHALEATNSQCLVLDSLHNLLLGMTNSGEPRVEIMQLFDWAREKDIATLVTISESPVITKKNLLEEYAVDCVIHLTQTLEDHLMTRYLRVIKLRGSAHGTNDYPFSLRSDGIRVLPITATRLDKGARSTRTSTGIATLDNMLGGDGYFDGSALMFSGRSGSAKTVFAASLAVAAVKQGQKALFISFEEAPGDLEQNLASVGMDLQKHTNSGGLTVTSHRAAECGLEEHLIRILEQVELHNPDLLVLDPVSSLADMGSTRQVKMLLIRFVAHIRSLGTTLLFTELMPDASEDFSNLSISSLVDTWFRLRQVESNGEFNRLINVIKSRGSATSNQTKEFLVTEHGIEIEDPYIGSGEMVFGSAKAAKIQQDLENQRQQEAELSRLQSALAAEQQGHESTIATLNAEFEEKRKALQEQFDRLKRQQEHAQKQRNKMQEVRE
ncbi:MAG: circadian clock protein KaiC [Candidatus Thiodiazotropha taylori]|nr:circadian clock protein KaiC [Candidatus Thiodiazotropha taylori]